MNFLKIALCAFTLSISAVSHAELVSSDHAVYGSNKITTDTTTGLKWLGLDVTQGMSVNEAKEFITQSGGAWRLPTENEVIHYMQELVKHDTLSFEVNRNQPQPISTSDNSIMKANMAKIGITFQNGNDIYSFGWHVTMIDGQEAVLSSGFQGRFTTGNTHYFGNLGTYQPSMVDADLKMSEAGVFLVAVEGVGESNISDVPTPIMASFLLPILFLTRRKKIKTTVNKKAPIIRCFFHIGPYAVLSA